MTDRKKLMELIEEICNMVVKCCGCSDMMPKYSFNRKMVYSQLADYLIANGVTVQNWRDAKTDPPTKGGQYLVFISCEQGEWIETDEFNTASKIWRSVNGYHENATEFVTHWMPKLGTPSKGINPND